MALDRAAHSPWHEHDSRLIPVDLLDDEWLPSVTYQRHGPYSGGGCSLAPNSALRRDFDIGERGDGINYAWMDKMRTEGIRRVEFEISIDFHDDGQPGKMRVVSSPITRNMTHLMLRFKTPNAWSAFAKAA